MGQRIGLFGGTFDPIHSGHLQVAEKAANTFALDRVLFIPAANPPHKPAGEVAPYPDRFRMCELACAPYPRFVVSDLESGPGKSYTIHTVERVRRELFPDAELFFLIGADAFDELETWKRWRDLVKLTDFIVVSRPGATYHIPEGARVHQLDQIQIPVSSSQIRAKLARGEPDPELPAAVLDYIREHGLYGMSARESTTRESTSLR
jgi:nicotinate-nucleotide adenylyltransferase